MVQQTGRVACEWHARTTA